ncbi:uncharacterized protein LOC127247242 [Andrographis paniculata]|uniref:uncharacterized protein LOC127247242 n=1 Tax=Andrographis paniculata TaxID=175694 RepID=UPI0021E767CF|nr:uncharacterized protein LOC127247242 [Andrographis paniculata]
MAEEFEESEIIFQEEEDNNEIEIDNFQANSIESINKEKTTKMNGENSVPMSIPEHLYQNPCIRSANSDLDGDETEMVPPHVIIGRRAAGKMMALSVCTGNERTLKGRNLNQVRNSVLRMTGFLET